MVVCICGMCCVYCVGSEEGGGGGQTHTAVCYCASNTRGARGSTRAAQPVAVNCGELQCGAVWCSVVPCGAA